MKYNKTKMEEMEDNLQTIFFDFHREILEIGRQVKTEKYIDKVKSLFLNYFINEE